MDWELVTAEIGAELSRQLATQVLTPRAGAHPSPTPKNFARKNPLQPSPKKLPDNLPVPEDDGACRHLEGMKIPGIQLTSTQGRIVNLAEATNTSTS